MRRQRPRGSAGIGFFLVASVLLGGCGGDAGGPGENCVSAADCQGGLLCVAPGHEAGVGACAQLARTDTGGVYVDAVTGLEWQRATPAANMSWDSGVRYCQSLSLNGTGWSLPSVNELRSLIRGCPATESGGACEATNTCVNFDTCLSECTGCETNAGPAGGCYWPDELEGNCGRGALGSDVWYWTSTSLDDLTGAWYVVFNHAHVCGRSKDFHFGLVRCVR